jgi:hypothetical protein
MAGTLSEQEIWQFLQEIEAGTITLVPATEPQAVYAGNVVYQASNGWEIWVFNDCNAWDYIEAIDTADGRSIGFDGLDALSSLEDYRPSEEVAWLRYRIPGYLRFRCTQCGTDLEESEKNQATGFLCAACRRPDVLTV